MRVSVLVTTRNRPDALHRCLTSLARQSYPHLDVCVFDDASAVPLRTEALEVEGLSIQLLHSSTQLGPIEARNRLMQAATGDVFVVLDDDAYLDDDDALSRVVDAFDELPQAGLLAFKLIETRGDTEHLLLPHPRRALYHNPRLANQMGRVSNYLAGAHALRRTVFARCGPFRPALCYGHEELDLSYRAIEAGFEIWYLPHVVAYHVPEGAPSPASRAWKTYYLVRNRLIVAYTYLPARYAITHTALWLGWYLLVAVRQHTTAAFRRGLRDGLAALPRSKRRPLGEAALTYLQRHHGRLWY